MKRIILFTFLLSMTIFMVVSSVNAAPWLVCDPQPGVGYYQVTGASWVIGNIQPQTDGSLKLDLAQSAVGTTPLQIKACNVWGCSEPVPFDLLRLPAPSKPVSLRLMP